MRALTDYQRKLVVLDVDRMLAQVALSAELNTEETALLRIQLLKEITNMLLKNIEAHDE